MPNTVFLAYVHPGMVYDVFMQSVLGAFNHETPPVGYISVGGPYIPDSRNKAVEAFLKDTDYEWLWFLDYDIKFAPDTLAKLLAVADPKERPIVGAAYWTYFCEGTNVCWMVAQDSGFHAVVLDKDKEYDPGNLLEVTAVGMGCTLIHRSVLEKMEKEYADDPWHWFGHDVSVSDNGSDRVGEDLTFCVRAKKCGFPVYGYPYLQVDHFKNHIVGT